MERWLFSDHRIDSGPLQSAFQIVLGKDTNPWIPESSVWMFMWMAPTEQVPPDRVVAGLSVCATMTLRSHTFTWGKASMQNDTSLCDRESLILHHSSLQNVITIMAEIVLHRDVFLLTLLFSPFDRFTCMAMFALLLVNKQRGCAPPLFGTSNCWGAGVKLDTSLCYNCTLHHFKFCIYIVLLYLYSFCPAPLGFIYPWKRYNILIPNIQYFQLKH